MSFFWKATKFQFLILIPISANWQLGTRNSNTKYEESQPQQHCWLCGTYPLSPTFKFSLYNNPHTPKGQNYFSHSCLLLAPSLAGSQGSAFLYQINEGKVNSEWPYNVQLCSA